MLRAIKLLNMGKERNFQAVVELHYTPLIPQCVILIPFLIIESIFWGTHCNDDHIGNNYMQMADKAFVFFVPGSLLWALVTAITES